MMTFPILSEKEVKKMLFYNFVLTSFRNEASVIEMSRSLVWPTRQVVPPKVPRPLTRSI